MSRNEFIRTLEECLAGEIPERKIKENIKFYDGYFSDQLAKGRSEEEILQELGDPHLIARTILDTSAAGTNREFQSQNAYFDENGFTNEAEDFEHQKGFHMDYDEHKGWDVRFGKLKLNTWYGKLAVLMIVLSILIFVLVIVTKIVYALIPLILLIVVIRWLISQS